MKPSRFCRFCSIGPVVALALAAAFVAGCQNLLVPRHKVFVDAISAPEAAKPSGKSYRLVARRSVISQLPVQIPVVKACVDAALSGQGMFEAPENGTPDLFVEVSYGRDAAPRADPAARETFLQLSARSNPQGSRDRATGPELWDVRVAILGVAGPVESAMPLLAAVAANHVATNTKIETKVEIPQNSPMIESVRSSAIKTLESKAPPVAPATAGQPGSSGGAPAAAPTTLR